MAKLVLRKHFIVFRDHPLAYGRVPKVANSSIKSALTTLLSERPEKGVRIQSDRFWREPTNDETAMLSPEEALKLRMDKFIFAFVRNPFDRLVSSYHNKIMSNEELTRRMSQSGFTARMSFPDFVRCTVDVADNELDVHLMPQSQMLLHNGSIVPHFIGYFEFMSNEWERLREILTAKRITLPNLTFKNVRREDRDDIRKYLNSDQLISMVSSKYAKDISIFYPGVDADKLISGQFEIPAVTGQAKPDTSPSQALTR